MITRIGKILALVFIALLLADVRPVQSEGWSLLNPFGINTKKETKKKFGMKSQPEPSLWEKTTSGTKDFFNKTGETLGMKKTTTKKSTVMLAKSKASSSKKKKSQSWLSKLFQSEKK